MLANLKRILLTQYIGAIITAYMAAQGILGCLALVTYTITWWLEGKRVSVYGGFSRPAFDWNRVEPELVRIVLQLLVAAGFLVWLYRAPQAASIKEPVEDLMEES